MQFSDAGEKTTHGVLFLVLALVWMFEKAFLSMCCLACKSHLVGGDYQNKITVQTKIKGDVKRSFSKQPVGPDKITPKMETM